MGKQAVCEKCGKKFRAIVPDNARDIICFACAKRIEEEKKIITLHPEELE